MRIVTTREEHLPILMRWFSSERECRQWGGPGFRYPFDAATFRGDTRFGELPSWSLVGADDASLCGFGQYYARLGRCHLARLAIAPALRGRGLGEILVRRLVEVGCADLGLAESSLFVLEDNVPALALYRRIGYVPEPYPEHDPKLASCIYMVWAPPSC